MTECEFCGEMIPDDADVCPFCGSARTAEDAAPVERPAEDATIEETAALPEDTAEDDGWRPYRYERRTQQTRRKSRARVPDQRTLQLLAGWLAALIVIAGGIFWYIWSENEPATQTEAAPLTAAITAEQR